jgi:F-type H+-transporting ATPase subunit delta
VTEPGHREAYQPAAERLASYAGSATPEALAALADELLAVAGLLTREVRLRRALADPARSGEERSGLLSSVLDGRVGDETHALLAGLVGGRFRSGGELLDTVERLGVDALLASADRAGALSEVEDELFRFTQVVDGAPELAATLADPVAEVEHRSALVDDLLQARANPVTVGLVRLALVGFGGRGFVASLARLVELAAEARERQLAYVVSAVPLTEQDEQRLGARLAEMYGREVSLKVSVQPRILGGLSVQVGSDLYDGTVLRRLNEIRAALTK